MRSRVLLAALACLVAVGASSAQTRRNSFVVDLLDETAPAAGVRTFHAEGAHWLFVRLEGGGALTLDGQPLLGGAGEAKRWVAAGDHELGLTGTATRLIARRIPEVFGYMMEWHNTPSPTVSYHYTKDFLERYLLPSCTTLVSNSNPAYEPDAAAWQAAGGTWLSNQGMETIRKPDADLVEYWYNILSKPMFDGSLHDELLSQDPAHYARWAQVMPEVLAKLPAGKRIYYWAPWSVLQDAEWPDYFALDREAPGEGQISLKCSASPDKLRTFRRSDLVLQAGQKYTLSCLMRASNLQEQVAPGVGGYDGGSSGVFIINNGWYSTGGSLVAASLAGPEWKLYSKTFTVPESNNEKYQLIISPPARGTLWMDQIRLEPGETVGAGENVLTNGDFEQEWAGWPAADNFTTLQQALQATDGRLWIEAYQDEAASDEALDKAINTRLLGGVRSLLKTYPDFGPHVGIAFSAGKLPLNYNNDVRPDINWKTNLDRQFHAAANDPAFETIGGVGDWSLHYVDEEGLRWYGALYRHYLIEGSREPLSPWPLTLEHLTNPGFEDGVDGWTLTGAAETVTNKAAFGDLRKGNYAPVPEGKLTLRTAPGATFSQTVRNLRPGQAYSVTLYVANAAWSKGEIPADITVTGATLVPERGEVRNWTMSRTSVWSTMHRVVFRATAETAELTIGSNATEPLFWDFIQVEPYYES